MPISGRVSGVDGFKATLAAMPDLVRSALGEAIRVSASEMVRDAKARVPRDTGTLRDHIGFSFSPTYARAKVGILPGTVVVRDDQRTHDKKLTTAGAKALRAQGYKTYRASHYAHLVEYGGRGGRMPAQPFMDPAFRGQQGDLDSRMRAAQRQTVDDLSAIGARYL